ncbi:hypothetical protein J4Q44_G00011010 [Coregonus suidteri]|uniref:Uncharacterized protein n=1 Tax=Coregonus suidteri TaxID=861788 RepID=A0AAN8MLW6_9TELE
MEEEPHGMTSVNKYQPAELRVKEEEDHDDLNDQRPGGSPNSHPDSGKTSSESGEAESNQIPNQGDRTTVLCAERDFPNWDI